jgi:hypothetical protein
MELFEHINKLNTELTSSIKVLAANGKKLAEAERLYRIKMTTEALILKDKGEKVTLIELILKGLPEVAKLRFDRDVAETTYEANKEHINAVKLQLRVLQEQWRQEFGNASGYGD